MREAIASAQEALQLRQADVDVTLQTRMTAQQQLDKLRKDFAVHARPVIEGKFCKL